jgi:hypothetical protein
VAGIHWAFDKTAGIEQGRQVADYVMKNVFTPVRGGRNHEHGWRNLPIDRAKKSDFPRTTGR